MVGFQDKLLKYKDYYFTTAAGGEPPLVDNSGHSLAFPMVVGIVIESAPARIRRQPIFDREQPA